MAPSDQSVAGERSTLWYHVKPLTYAKAGCPMVAHCNMYELNIQYHVSLWRQALVDFPRVAKSDGPSPVQLLVHGRGRGRAIALAGHERCRGETE